MNPVNNRNSVYIQMQILNMRISTKAFNDSDELEAVEGKPMGNFWFYLFIYFFKMGQALLEIAGDCVQINPYDL